VGGLGEQIAAYAVVGAPEDRDLRAITRLAAQICGVTMASVNLLDESQQHMVAIEGFEGRPARREQSMCAVSVLRQEPVHVRDAREDPRFAQNPFVNGELGCFRFYAASQLRTSRGAIIGTLCVYDEQPRELGAGQRSALDDLATQVMQILELRERSAELARTNAELSRSNADLASFAGRVSHDLRNPIAASKGFLALARTTFGDELSGRARECVEHAAAATDRMAELVDDLLVFAAVGAHARRESVDLTRVLGAVVSDVHALVESTGGLVVLGSLPTVQSDPTLVRQLVQNFLTNGLKYARPGVPPVVEVSGTAEGDAWSLSVSDNGRGIPAEDRAAVFELFVRLPGGRDVSGSGIGLAICARIAEALGAEITIADSPEGGTTFTISVAPAS